MQKWRKPATVSMSWDVIIAKSSKSAHTFAPLTRAWYNHLESLRDWVLTPLQARDRIRHARHRRRYAASVLFAKHMQEEGHRRVRWGTGQFRRRRFLLAAADKRLGLID